MATNQQDVEQLFGVKYGINTDVITRPKSEYKGQAKSQTKIVPDNNVLSRT